MQCQPRMPLILIWYGALLCRSLWLFRSLKVPGWPLPSKAMQRPHKKLQAGA